MYTAHEKLIFILLTILFVSFLIQGYYYLAVYLRLPLYKPTGKGETLVRPVSIVVCAKNELGNLQKNLPRFLEQDYPDYEVVVVDDCSWDESGAYLELLQKENSRLRLVTLKEQERYRHGKKFALTLGIKAAKHEFLLLAVADCVAAGPIWLSSMQGQFTD